MFESTRLTRQRVGLPGKKPSGDQSRMQVAAFPAVRANFRSCQPCCFTAQGAINVPTFKKSTLRSIDPIFGGSAGPRELTFPSFHGRFVSGIPDSKFSGTNNRVPTIQFLVQRVSKVPQPAGQMRALGKEVMAISKLLAGTIIAENVTGSSRLVL